MNTADYIVKKLEELGVNDFFGLPGDYNFSLLYAVQNNKNTNWIGCINELNAGYAADGYARIKGYGALITTYGVGELSAINAIAGSYAESIPVCHIVGIPSSSSISNRDLLHHNFQDVNYFAFVNSYKNVTSTTAFLTRDNAKIEIDRVFKVLVKEKKPVYIAVPMDIAEMEITERYSDNNWSSDKDTLEKVTTKIIEKINNAKSPIILGDGLISRFDSRIEYKEFVEKTGLPVTNFLMGTNLINMDYDKYIGGYYGKFKNPIARQYVEETDCLIAVGPIYSDLNSFGFNIPFNINSHIAIYGTYTYIENVRYENIKMADVLEEITKKIETKNVEIEKPNIGYKIKSIEEQCLDSDYIYARLQEFFKDNDIIIAETGMIPYGICQTKFNETVNPQFQTLWASIGWATPAAFGAGIAKPQSRVILVTGDGAHQLTAMEIGNMLRYGLKPIIIVINNNGYTIERYLSKQMDNDFNNIVKINYTKFARSFDGDIWATKVTTKDDFDKALKVTQIMNKMCYIEVVIDYKDAPKLTKNFLENLEADNTKEKENTTPIPSAKDNYKKVNLSDFESSGFEYETVVHKGLTEKEISE